MNGPKLIWRAAKAARRANDFHTRLALARARLRWTSGRRYSRAGFSSAALARR